LAPESENFVKFAQSQLYELPKYATIEGVIVAKKESHNMSVQSSDYVGLQLTEARLRELQREARRLHQAQEYLKLHPVKRRLRLPKITITWN
jgi:hypothetical protein